MKRFLKNDVIPQFNIIQKEVKHNNSTEIDMI